nr:MAG TPA: hypothetical protein [Caudoviricetes sp.]
MLKKGSSFLIFIILHLLQILLQSLTGSFGLTAPDAV